MGQVLDTMVLGVSTFLSLFIVDLFFSETAQVVDPVNTLEEKLQTNSKFRDDIVDSVQRKYSNTSSQRKDLIAQERAK